MKPLLILLTATTLLHAEHPVVFRDDFSKGLAHWTPTDTKMWKITEVDGNPVLHLLGKSNYKPPHRSPHSIALLDGKVVGSFVLTARLQTTQTTRGHRDLCIFFGYRDPAHFYYVHLGEKPDPHSSQVFIVNGAPRTALTKSKTGIPWKDGQWHDLKVVRNAESGKIDVFFDDMQTPAKSAVDKTFPAGQVGLGSFDDHGYFDDFRLKGVEVKAAD